MSTTAKQPREAIAGAAPERAVGTGLLVVAGVVVLLALVIALFYSGAAAARQLGDPVR